MPTPTPNDAVPFKFTVWKWINWFYDLLQNVQMIPRKSDTWISQDLFMLAMRDGTERVWNDSWNTTWCQNQIFFTWENWTRAHYKTYNKKVYKLVAWTWTDIWGTFTSDNFFLNVVKLPYWNPSSVYQTAADASWIEKLKPSASDTTPTNNIGKYVMIVGSDNPTVASYATTNTYRNKYAYISSYDSTNWEYLLEWLGNGQAIIAWVSYRIFDRLWNYLQVTNGVDDDIYYDGTAIQTIFTWRIKDHIERITSKTTIGKVFMYNASLWLYISNILYRSDVWNLLWFSLPNIIEMQDFDTIQETFVWKNRLIVWGSRSLVYYQYDTNIKAYTTNVISSNYWVYKWWVNNFDKNAYLFTNNRELISLSENIYWVVNPENVGRPVQNYLNDFNYNITSWFDWRKFYLYGEKTAWFTWVTCVYDSQMWFWSTWTWIAPQNFLLEWTAFYYGSYRNGNVFQFKKWMEKDDWTDIIQEVSTVDFYAPDEFSVVEASEIFTHVENFTQEFEVKFAWALTTQNYTKKVIFSHSEVSAWNSSLWESVLWEEVLWWKSFTTDITLPIMYKFMLNWDKVNILKIYIKWVNGSPFYLNNIMANVKRLASNYFNPSKTK